MSKLSQMYGVTYQNLGEKGTKPIEKELGQSGLPVLRKIQKTAPVYCIGGRIFRWEQHLHIVGYNIYMIVMMTTTGGYNDCAAMQIKALIAFIRNILGRLNLGEGGYIVMI